jgi:hypothetical protein
MYSPGEHSDSKILSVTGGEERKGSATGQGLGGGIEIRLTCRALGVQAHLWRRWREPDHRAGPGRVHGEECVPQRATPHRQPVPRRRRRQPHAGEGGSPRRQVGGGGGHANDCGAGAGAGGDGSEEQGDGRGAGGGGGPGERRNKVAAAVGQVYDRLRRRRRIMARRRVSTWGPSCRTLRRFTMSSQTSATSCAYTRSPSESLPCPRT